jgi:hypothetical protein
MLVEDVHCEVLGDMRLALPVEVIEHGLYSPLSPHLQTHPHLVLEVDLHVVAYVTAQVHLHLQRRVNIGQYLGPTVVEVGQLGAYLAPVRAVVSVLALFAELEGRVVLTAVNALRQHYCSVLIHVDLAAHQQVWRVFSVMVEHDLQIIVVGLVAAIETQLVPSQAPRH